MDRICGIPNIHRMNVLPTKARRTRNGVKKSSCTGDHSRFWYSSNVERDQCILRISIISITSIGLCPKFVLGGQGAAGQGG